LPVKARSVPFFRMISYCSGVSSVFHSASVLFTFVVIVASDPDKVTQKA
jgi:hypothetical protein